MKQNNPLYSTIPTERINDAVVRDVSPLLFAFCDYNPHAVRVFGPDAIFLQSVGNLYKLMIDASICNWMKQIVHVGSQDYGCMIDEMQELNKTINMLRSAQEHNQAENSKILKAYQNWLCEQNDGRPPASPDEFQKPLAELEHYAETMMKLMENIIAKIKIDTQKDDIIDRWIQKILKLYRANGHILCKAYLQEVLQAKYSSRNIDDYRMSRWIEEYIITQGKNIEDVRRVYQHAGKQEPEAIRKRQGELDGFRKRLETQADAYPYKYLRAYLEFIQYSMEHNYNNQKNIRKHPVKNLRPENIMKKLIWEKIQEINIPYNRLGGRRHT